MTHHRVAPTAIGLLLVLVGLVVGTGGVWLMALGGSWYYLPAGLLLVLTGLLLLQGNPAALPTHALLLGLTLAWSLWESGLNAWALAARGDVLWVLGLVMATPWFLRGLEGPVPRAARRGLATALAVFAAVGLAALLQPATAGPGIFGLTPASAPSTTRIAEPRPIDLPQPLSEPLPPAAACLGALRAYAVDERQAAAFTAVHGPDCAVMQAAAEDGDSLAGLSHPQPVTGADMWGLTLIDHLACRIAFERMRFDSRFIRLMAPGQRRQTPAPADGRQLVLHGPSALMYTTQVVLPRSAVRAAEAADALARLALAHPSEGIVTAQLAPVPNGLNGSGVLRLADGGQAMRLQPFLSPIGLPCQTPPWRLQAAAEPAESEPVTAPAAPAPLSSGTPMAAAQVSDLAAL